MPTIGLVEITRLPAGRMSLSDCVNVQIADYGQIFLSACRSQLQRVRLNDFVRRTHTCIRSATTLSPLFDRRLSRCSPVSGDRLPSTFTDHNTGGKVALSLMGGALRVFPEVNVGLQSNFGFNVSYLVVAKASAGAAANCWLPQARISIIRRRVKTPLSPGFVAEAIAVVVVANSHLNPLFRAFLF